MKMKYFLTVCLCLIFNSFAMADNAEDLFNQGVTAHKKENFTQAAKLYEQACKNNHTDSCYNLGILYENGQGVKQNHTQAAKLYE